MSEVQHCPECDTVMEGACEYCTLKAENAKLRGVLQNIVFVGTKGTAQLWPAMALENCVLRAKEALGK